MSALLDQAAVETNSGVLSLTEGAIREVKRILETNKVPETMRLRVGVTGGGCSGMSYQLGFDQQRENDEVLSIGGLEVLLDKRHAIYLMGTEVDFVDGLQGRGFEFKNPTAKKTCGCGSSFSA